MSGAAQSGSRFRQRLREADETAAHYPGPAPVACEDSAAAFIARRVALMLARSPSRLAAMIAAARSGAFAATSRR